MIRGLEARMRPPRLGTIGLGIIVGQGDKAHPQETAYFVVPADGAIAKQYGEKPTMLPIRFPWSEPEQVLHSIAYTQRAGRSVVRRCDGERYCEIRGSGQDVIGACERPADNIYAPCPAKCRATARLSVVVPKTPLGLWEIRVGGLQRIADLLGELRLYRAAVGPLTHLPFELGRVEAQEQYYDAQGQARTRKGYPVRLRCPYTVEEVVALQEARGLPIALPPAPHDEDVVDADDESDGAPAPTAPEPLPAEAAPLEAGERVSVRGVEGVVVPHAEAPRAEVTPPPPATEAPRDVAWCFAEAKRLGIDAADYGLYLWGVYGVRARRRDAQETIDNLTTAETAEQATLLARAGADAAQTKAVADTVRLVAKGARDGKVGNGRQGRLV